MKSQPVAGLLPPLVTNAVITPPSAVVRFHVAPRVSPDAGFDPGATRVRSEALTRLDEDRGVGGADLAAREGEITAEEAKAIGAANDQDVVGGGAAGQDDAGRLGDRAHGRPPRASLLIRLALLVGRLA